MNNLKVRRNNNEPTGARKQRQHHVMLDDRVIGILYDNRFLEAGKKSAEFTFFPSASRVAGEFLARDDDSGYLTHAVGIKGDDLDTILPMIREWVGAVQEWVAGFKAEFYAVLKTVDPLEFDVVEEYADQELRAVVLGPNGHCTMELSWSDMAKIHGYGYEEVGRYQVTDSGLRGRAYGLRWQYFRNSEFININTFSGSRVMSIARTDEHRKSDSKY